jgi:uncharacterized protein YihD (DUF1040 family)
MSIEITIVDNTFTRLSRLKFLLEFSQEVNVKNFHEVEDVTKGIDSELFLIHKGNKNIGSFTQNISPKSLIVFFSGGGINKNIEGITYSERMFNLPDVFNAGNEEQPVHRIKQIIEIVRNKPNNTNAITKIKKVLGFDEEEENLTDEIFNAIYEQKDEDAIEKALSKRDKYINTKHKN